MRMHENYRSHVRWDALTFHHAAPDKCAQIGQLKRLTVGFCCKVNCIYYSFEWEPLLKTGFFW